MGEVPNPTLPASTNAAGTRQEETPGILTSSDIRTQDDIQRVPDLTQPREEPKINSRTQRAEKLWTQLRKLNKGILVTLNEVTAPGPVDLNRVSRYLTCIVNAHENYKQASAPYHGPGQLNDTIRSNNVHNQALIVVLDQLITAKTAELNIAPVVQPTVSDTTTANQTYKKHYGFSYDFAAMTVLRRGERLPPLTIQSTPKFQQRVQLSAQANKGHSGSVPIPTFEFPSQSATGVPTLFPVSSNHLETRVRNNTQE